MRPAELRFFSEWLRSGSSPSARWDPSLRADVVLRIAEQNRLLPLMGCHLAGDPPPAVAAACERAYARSVQRNYDIERWTALLLDALHRRGIQAAVLRGPLMARRLYGDSALRPSHDIDLLVPRDRLLEAHSALLDERLTSWPAASPPQYFARYHFHLPHRLEPSGIRVDLHFALDHALLPHAIPYPFLLAATNRAGMLSIEDEFPVCVLHAGKHAWFLPCLLRPDRYPPQSAAKEALLNAFLASRTLLLLFDLRRFLDSAYATHLPTWRSRIADWHIQREAWYVLAATAALCGVPDATAFASLAPAAHLSLPERALCLAMRRVAAVSPIVSRGPAMLMADAGFRWVRMLDAWRILFPGRAFGGPRRLCRAVLHFLSHLLAFACLSMRGVR